MNIFKKNNALKIVDVCLIIALIAVSVYSLNMVVTKEYHGDAIFVNSNSKKKLPIYSVETDKPVVAISFDAAWGEMCKTKLLNIYKHNNYLLF